MSAFNFPGKPRFLIEMAAEGEVQIDVSDEIIEEVLRVLKLKFQWSVEALAGANWKWRPSGARRGQTSPWK
jgi:hypothetical protein